MSNLPASKDLGFVLQTARLGFSGTSYEVEVIGADAFIHFKYSDGKPIIVAEAPLPVAMQIASSVATGMTVTINFTAKKLMDAGEPTEHWCARFLGCKFKK